MSIIEAQNELRRIRVFVVDDHVVARAGVRSLLSAYPDMELVGEADGGSACLHMLATLKPDVVLLDSRLAGANGFCLVRQIRQIRCECKVILLNADCDDAFLIQAAQASVRGYLLKTASSQSLAEAIRGVSTGGWRLSPELADAAFSGLHALWQRARASGASPLSEQEHRMLELIAKGTRTGDIAEALYVSERTVKRRTQQILEKLQATSRAQAVAEAFKRGLI
ncbi:MAG: response regulator transcription factor [Chloroflexi bacterium]|nr:response regulator transcription factor [Chloroflexota bacterium]